MKTLIKVCLFLFVTSQVIAQNSTLPRSTPEAEGVSSAGIIQFVDAAAAAKKDGLEFHSYMVLRHGKVIAEGWWNPYSPVIKHTLYSVSKSFTATAIGFAVSEKRLKVNDPVISFFPNDLPDTISENLKALTIKDLLTMSVGHEKEYTGAVITSDNWVKTFLSKPIFYPPGTKFLYNTAATYMLSAIVTKVTGKKVIDYLQPRLFGPLGISGIDWETDPAGINTGGYGLRLKTEDMAKFGLLFLQKGMWEGKQVLPEAWVQEASTKKIDQEPNATKARLDTSDWVQGYCYQMWRSRFNGYRGDGANGQYILVWPEQDAVVITTAEVSDMQAEINLVFKYLLPAFKTGKLPADPKNLATLRTKSAALNIAPPIVSQSPKEAMLAGKTFAFAENDKRLKSISFSFDKNNLRVTLVQDTGKYLLNFGRGHWQAGDTKRYGPYLVAGAKGDRIGLSPFKLYGGYGWPDTNTLQLALYYIESPHHETFNIKFDGDSLTLDLVNFANQNQARTVYKASLLKAE